MGSRLRSSTWRRQCAARIALLSYASLFTSGKNQISGEITPAYATLSADTVGHIKSIMPDVKIIYVLRNPIHRAWSHAINRLVRREKREFEEISNEQLIEHIDSRGSTLRTDYLCTVRNWESHFPTDQIFYGFYDDLLQRPAQLLNDIYTFLQVDSRELDLCGSQEKRTKPQMGSRYEIPSEVKTHIAREYFDSIVELSAHFDSHAEDWLAEAESSLEYGK